MVPNSQLKTKFIYVYNKEKKLIAKYASKSETSRELNISRRRILEYIDTNYLIKSNYYIYSYPLNESDIEFKGQFISPLRIAHNAESIIVLDKEKIRLNEYKSQREAAEALNLRPDRISKTKNTNKLINGL